MNDTSLTIANDQIFVLVAFYSSPSLNLVDGPAVAVINYHPPCCAFSINHSTAYFRALFSSEPSSCLRPVEFHLSMRDLRLLVSYDLYTAALHVLPVLVQRLLAYSFGSRTWRGLRPKPRLDMVMEIRDLDTLW